MRVFLSTLFLIILLDSYPQSFPDLSPKGRIIQLVGFTTITVGYERPAARGRKVIGELVPFGKLWRTGAGTCTKIQFSKPVTIDNKTIGAGAYSLFTIPNLNDWTVIVNSDTSLYGTGSYDEKKDVVRFKVKPESTGRYYESLTIDLDVVPNNAVLYMAWEKTQIHFTIETETDKKAVEFIDQNLLTDQSADPDQYARAAEYYFYLNKDLPKAITLINKAIVKKDAPWYYRLKIDILEKQENYPEAIEAANQAIEFMQKHADELGWSSKTKQQEIEGTKARIEAFQKKLRK